MADPLGAGYEQDHAWWFVYQDDADLIAFMHETIDRIPDDHYPAMVQGRMTYEAGKAVVGDTVQ